jgi:hypothetical protein
MRFDCVAVLEREGCRRIFEVEVAWVVILGWGFLGRGGGGICFEAADAGSVSRVGS